MIDKRIKYRYGGDTMGGRNDKSRSGPGGPPGGGATSMGSGRDFSKGPSSTNREKGIMSQYTGPKGTTGNIKDFKDTGPDRSKVSQFSKYGKNVFAKNLNPNLRFDPKTGTMKNRFAPSMIFGGLLSLLSGIPGLGFAISGLTKGAGFLNDKLQDLRGYNPDGTPRTQEQYEQARRDRQIQNRIDNIMERQRLGKSFSQTNLDSLLGMTDMYGNQFSPSTAQNVLTGRDLKGFTDSRMGLTNPEVIEKVIEKFANPIGPQSVNVPSTGIKTIDVGYGDPAFDNTLSADASYDQQKNVLENILNTEDTGVGEFIEDKEQKDKRQQQLLNEIMTG